MKKDNDVPLLLYYILTLTLAKGLNSITGEPALPNPRTWSNKIRKSNASSSYFSDAFDVLLNSRYQISSNLNGKPI